LEERARGRVWRTWEPWTKHGQPGLTAKEKAASSWGLGAGPDVHPVPAPGQGGPGRGHREKQLVQHLRRGRPPATKKMVSSESWASGRLLRRPGRHAGKLARGCATVPEPQKTQDAARACPMTAGRTGQCLVQRSTVQIFTLLPDGIRLLRSQFSTRQTCFSIQLTQASRGAAQAADGGGHPGPRQVGSPGPPRAPTPSATSAGLRRCLTSEAIRTKRTQQARTDFATLPADVDGAVCGPGPALLHDPDVPSAQTQPTFFRPAVRGALGGPVTQPSQPLKLLAEREGGGPVGLRCR